MLYASKQHPESISNCIAQFVSPWKNPIIENPSIYHEYRYNTLIIAIYSDPINV